MKIIWSPKTFVLVLAALFPLSGCGLNPSQPWVSSKQFFPSNFSSGDSLGVIIKSYEKCDSGQTEDCTVTPELLKEKQSFLYDCIMKGIHDVDNAIEVVKLDAGDAEVIEMLNNSQENRAGNKNDRMDEIVISQELINKYKSLNIRYVVLLKTRTSDTKMDGHFDAVDRLGFVFGGDSFRKTKMEGEIYEISTMRKSGELLSVGNDQYGWAVPVLFIIPLPPAINVPMIEVRTCVAMGETIGNFVSGVNVGRSFDEEDVEPISDKGDEEARCNEDLNLVLDDKDNEYNLSLPPEVIELRKDNFGSSNNISPEAVEQYIDGLVSFMIDVQGKPNDREILNAVRKEIRRVKKLSCN